MEIKIDETYHVASCCFPQYIHEVLGKNSVLHLSFIVSYEVYESFPVPRNSTACFLDPQKYSLMFPKIPNIFQFLMLGYFHKFYFTIYRRENHPASTIHLFRLLDECHITSCSLAEISVDSAVKVMSSLVC